MSSNGHLTGAELSPITGGVGNPSVGEGCLSNQGPAQNWNAMGAEVLHDRGIHIGVTGPDSSYRSYEKQVYYWNLYQSGRGNLAAYPGTSNHGLGYATDVPTFMLAVYSAYGSKYGWGPCSDAPSEWWHRKWCGGHVYPDPGGGGGQVDRTPLLHQGMHGAAVKRAQKHLRRWNIGITRPKEDGDFGPKTRKAVIQFQAAHHMTVDGKIGNETWKQIRRVDHFLADERWHLNNLRLAAYRRDHGSVSKTTRQKMSRWRKWCGARSAHIWKLGHESGADMGTAYRATRFHVLRAASGRG